MARIRNYSTGIVDIFGEPSIEDIQSIKSKIESKEIKIFSKELNIYFNDNYEISDIILHEFIMLLENSSIITTIFIDLLHSSFMETIKLYKNRNGAIDKYYKIHNIAHFTEFQDSQRSDFYLGRFRSTSKQFEDLTLSTDVGNLSFVENSHGELLLTKLRVNHARCIPRLSRVLTENTLATLRSIQGMEYTPEFWSSLRNNTHVTKLKCHFSNNLADIYDVFADTMRHNKTLKHLFVSWFYRDDNELLPFEALKLNTSISRLHLNKMSGSVREDFFEDLADYLSHNTVLTHLHISLQQIGKDTDVKIFYDSLRASIIHHLTLQLPTYDVTLLADFISTNKTLLSLSVVNHHSFDKESTDRIFKALEQNETICYWHHNLNAAYRDSLQMITCEVNQVLRRNKKKREVYINDMVVLLFNIARGSDALRLLPKELWLKIFAQVNLIGFEYRFHDVLASLFRDAQIRQVVFCPNK